MISKTSPNKGLNARARVPLYLEAEEYKRLKAEAARSGLSISAWIRAVVLRELDQAPPLPVPPPGARRMKR